MRKTLPFIAAGLLAACQNNAPPAYGCEGLEDFGCPDSPPPERKAPENTVENRN